MITLRALNSGPVAQFVQNLAGVFEHSPWVAERAAAGRPFTSRLELLDALRAVVSRASMAEQLALIRAHPRLGVRGRPAVELTVASAREQHRAGLEVCTAEELARLNQLNDAYFAKFEAPFILAVRGHNPASIIANCEARLMNSPAYEHALALHQIGLIAGYRLADLIATPASVEVLAMNDRLTATTDAEGLIREWMNAAELEVSLDEQANLIGILRGTADATETLLIGAHVDRHSGLLVSDGRLGFLLGIALMQQLRQRGVWLEFDLAVVAAAADAVGLADLDVQTASVVQVPGSVDRRFARARTASHSTMGNFADKLDATVVERAVFSLEDFLLHNEQNFEDNGTLEHHSEGHHG